MNNETNYNRNTAKFTVQQGKKKKEGKY